LGQRLARDNAPRRESIRRLGDDRLVGRGVDASTRDSLAVQMSEYAGVLRDRDGLETLLETLDTTVASVRTDIDLATVEATNLHTSSVLVASAALLREESRGCHRRSDFSETSDAWGHAITLRVVDGEVLAETGVMAGA
jgi:aspartate oxidase